jgi:hypothetical protein
VDPLIFAFSEPMLFDMSNASEELTPGTRSAFAQRGLNLTCIKETSLVRAEDATIIVDFIVYTPLCKGCPYQGSRLTRKSLFFVRITSRNFE